MGKKYTFPAVFHPNGGGNHTITFPDIPGCISEGKTMKNSLYMAQDALTQMLEYMTDKNIEIPPASDADSIELSDGEFVQMITTK